MIDTPSTSKISLKNRSAEEKTAVAGGVALMVMLVLFFGWAAFFFKKVERSSITPTFENAVPEEFNFDSVRQAQKDLSESYKSVSEDLQTVREQSDGTAELPTEEMTPLNEEDAFGASPEP